MGDKVFCRFKHIPSTNDAKQLVINIETFVKPRRYDKNGIEACGENGDGFIDFQLTRHEANNLRARLNRILSKDPSPIYFSISSDPLDSIIEYTGATSVNDRQNGTLYKSACYFGSLFSYGQFYSHFNFDNQIVELSFQPVRSPDALKIEFDDKILVIPISSIQKRNILVNKENSNGVYILLSLKYSPNIYRLQSLDDNPKSKGKENKKQIRLCGDENHRNLVTNIAQCSDLVLHFKPTPAEAPWIFLHHLMHEREISCDINFSNFTISDWSNETDIKRPDPFNYKRASFEDRYALQMLISLGYVFRDKWAKHTNSNLNWRGWPVDARYKMCCFAVEKLREDHGYDLNRIEQDYMNQQKQIQAFERNKKGDKVLIPIQQHLRIPVCTLTPLKIAFQPLEITIGNRVVRNQRFGGPERFMIVHFREEDNRPLRASSYSIKQRLKTSMLYGIKLLEGNYQYLGASTGQMKEMSFWFIDLPSNFKNIKDAHESLGNFDSIKNIATYIARVGQYFSTTWPVDIKLKEVASKEEIPTRSSDYYIMKIDDIERNSYCFTDGVGKLSWGLAGRIAQNMNLELFCKEDIPSAFQVRVGGCKGMVVIDPSSSLNEYYMCIRKSMNKFDGHDWNLEICEFSRPLTLTLNNQVIRLLKDLGNEDSAFLGLQNRGLNQWEIPEEEQATIIDIALQKNASYTLSKDNLRTNRIPIPPDEGRVLYGVADETGTLKYGQCFIQYSSLDDGESSQKRFHIVTGDVIVTKNPCLWPGDVRRLKAVKSEILAGCMRDVIVFPTTGNRPHPNEMAGSDLDGDQYWVYWGKRFVVKSNVEALSYQGAEKAITSSITLEKIIDHIVNVFASNIILGMIANTHTVAAEKSANNSFDDDCKKLAELFALAVDSPKTGKFIEKEDIRKYQSKYCDSWPQYMRKTGEKVYESNSILQVLYSNALKKEKDLRQKPLMSRIPQQMKKIRQRTKDYDFQEWLRTGVYKPEAQLPQGKNTAVTHEDHWNEIDVPKPDTPMPKKEDSRKTSRQKKHQDSYEIEQPIDSKQRQIPEHSDASASSRSIDFRSNLVESVKPDFIMLASRNVIATTPIQFSSPFKNTLIIHPKHQGAENSDNSGVASKLASHMSKLDIFKKKRSQSKEPVHESLYLTVSYGSIYITNFESPPLKYGEFRERVKDKGDQIFHFEYIDADKLNMRALSRSVENKTKIQYAFDCFLTSSPSEYLTLLYDDKKNLRQIRQSCVLSKWYIRLVNYKSDNICQFRSEKLYEEGSNEFHEISNRVFPQGKSNELLTGRKPKIDINRATLSSSVVPINLKIIGHEILINIHGLRGDQAVGQKENVLRIDSSMQDESSISTFELSISLTENLENLENIFNFIVSLSENI